MYHMRQEVYTLRLPVEAIERLRTAAGARGLRPTQLLRTWILERLAAEPPLPARASEAVPGYGQAVPAPLRDVQGRIDAVCRSRGVATLKAFGSVVGASFRPDSDVDLVVTFQPMPPAMRADAFFGLEADLHGILDRPVDLLDGAALSNPYLARAIEESAVLLYVA